MIRHLIEKQLAREERRLGDSLDYLRHIARTSLPACLKFTAITPLSRHRSRLPVPLSSGSIGIVAETVDLVAHAARAEVRHA